jgi:endonuclease G
MKLTKKQQGIIAAAAVTVAGSLTPVAVLHFSPVLEPVTAFYAGMPVTTNTFIIVSNKTYVVAFDNNRQNPAWVAYQLTSSEDPHATGPKRPSRFKTDKRVGGRTHDDYTNTGFDRGHMAPNHAIAIRSGKAGQKETFLMSNVVPQTPGLNRGPWRKLESMVAQMWTEDSSVWVVTGPIYEDPRESLLTRLTIPDAFFKVVIRQVGTNTPETTAYILSQRVLMKDSFTGGLTTVDEVEEITGFDFFAELPDAVEGIIEAEERIW